MRNPVPLPGIHRQGIPDRVRREREKGSTAQVLSFEFLVLSCHRHTGRTLGNGPPAAEVPFSLLCESHSITLSDRCGHTMVKVAPLGYIAEKTGLRLSQRKRQDVNILCDGKSEIRNFQRVILRSGARKDLSGWPPSCRLPHLRSFLGPGPPQDDHFLSLDVTAGVEPIHGFSERIPKRRRRGISIARGASPGGATEDSSPTARTIDLPPLRGLNIFSSLYLGLTPQANKLSPLRGFEHSALPGGERWMGPPIWRLPLLRMTVSEISRATCLRERVDGWELKTQN